MYRGSPHDTVLNRHHDGVYLPMLLNASRGLNEEHLSAVPEPEPAELSPRSLRAVSASGTFL